MAQATLNITKDLILRLWSTMQESKDFGKVEYTKICAQQPDLVMVGRGKKHIVTFSLRSMQAIAFDQDDKFLGWREIQ